MLSIFSSVIPQILNKSLSLNYSSLKYVVLYNFSTWNSSPTNDGQSNCGGINLQGKMSDISCNSRQGYICNIELSPGKNNCEKIFMDDSIFKDLLPCW